MDERGGKQQCGSSTSVHMAQVSGEPSAFRCHGSEQAAVFTWFGKLLNIPISVWGHQPSLRLPTHPFTTSLSPRRELLDLAGVSLLSLSSEGRIESANKAALQLLGLSHPSQLIGQPFSAFFAPICGATPIATGSRNSSTGSTCGEEAGEISGRVEAGGGAQQVGGEQGALWAETDWKGSCPPAGIRRLPCVASVSASGRATATQELLQDAGEEERGGALLDSGEGKGGDGNGCQEVRMKRKVFVSTCEGGDSLGNMEAENEVAVSVLVTVCDHGDGLNDAP